MKFSKKNITKSVELLRDYKKGEIDKFQALSELRLLTGLSVTTAKSLLYSLSLSSNAKQEFVEKNNVIKFPKKPFYFKIFDKV